MVHGKNTRKPKKHQAEAEVEAIERRDETRGSGRVCPEKIIQDLRAGRHVTDSCFDQIYPQTIRDLSLKHWTPIEVARRAVRLLVADQKTRILDVGSGCGKLCIVGALTSHGQFIGIEQRPPLVEIALAAAAALRATQASFIPGNMADLDWDFFDGFYLFNPFYEHCDPPTQMDKAIAFSEERFERYVRIVEGKLKMARAGTRVVTYHGFGGHFPSGFRRVLHEPAGTSELELWIKERLPRMHSSDHTNDRVENPAVIE